MANICQRCHTDLNRCICQRGAQWTSANDPLRKADVAMQHSGQQYRLSCNVALRKLPATAHSQDASERHIMLKTLAVPNAELQFSHLQRLHEIESRQLVHIQLWWIQCSCQEDSFRGSCIFGSISGANSTTERPPPTPQHSDEIEPAALKQRLETAPKGPHSPRTSWRL